MKLVDCLVSHGARLDLLDIFNETLVHYSAVRGQVHQISRGGLIGSRRFPRLVEKLILLGVDFEAYNQAGLSAIQTAELNQQEVPSCHEVGVALHVMSQRRCSGCASDQKIWRLRPGSFLG
eukprot:364217-Hanusia_phi.AAC.3